MRNQSGEKFSSIIIIDNRLGMEMYAKNDFLESSQMMRHDVTDLFNFIVKPQKPIIFISRDKLCQSAVRSSRNW